MDSKNKLYLIILLLISTAMLSQNQTNRRWLIVVAEQDNPAYQKQIESITADESSAIERRIGIMHWSSKGATPVFNYPKTKHNPLAYLKDQISFQKSFEVILVGLDGTIKLRRNKPISPKSLFKRIDSMPMRQAEMQRKNNR
ncbi:MAG: DUF4174 domain-containing protein [Bacteroidetes bacterium]|jgi:hypothetical protein|nr:DUF4174 domain-containing protein [Bacteroidota bacterium]